MKVIKFVQFYLWINQKFGCKVTLLLKYFHDFRYIKDSFQNEMLS